MIHNVVHDEAPHALDIKRILAQHQQRDRAMQGSFCTGDFIDCFPLSDDAFIGMDSNDHQTETCHPLQAFYRSDLHQTTFTVLVNVPIPSIVMETTSPASKVNSDGGTIPVPVSNTTPSGNVLLRPR